MIPISIVFYIVGKPDQSPSQQGTCKDWLTEISKMLLPKKCCNILFFVIVLIGGFDYFTFSN